MARIHPTAVVDPAARIADDAVIGAYSCIGPDVELEAGVEIAPHVVVEGRTRIGAGTRVYPFASLGQPPQSLRYRGEPTRLEIGRRNIIREHVTMNTGTEDGGRVTRIGDDGFFMVGVHVAHDCQIGSRVIMANSATLGGHVVLGDHVTVGGLVAVHQFVRIGSHAMIGGMSALGGDVIPFGIAAGGRMVVPNAESGGNRHVAAREAVLMGLNLVGLRRRGFAQADIAALRAAYRDIFAGPGTLAERVAAFVSRCPGVGPVAELAAFLRAKGRRPLCRPFAVGGDDGTDDQAG
ncbi:MAG: acyl-ACP--UDP-N-acetylglucosamine O-acyltransferase [Rhodospirillaceae bacterium]|nr:acyl-ACP--UDP-N-acetylglucosamine O-acyltransferase [Rhodospirillaceae bacterium]